MRKWCVYISREVGGDRFYIGKSYVNKVHNGYQGSGIWMTRCLSSGVEFNTEIIETFATEQEALSYEEYLVSIHIDNDNNINLASGGRPTPVNVGSAQDSPRTLLSNNDVISIRSLLMSGRPANKIANEYNISFYAVSKIKNNNNWDYDYCKPSGYDNWLSSSEKLNNKITPWDALKIRTKIDNGQTQSKIAELYKISASSVCDIKMGRTYDKPYLYPR